MRLEDAVDQSVGVDVTVRSEPVGVVVALVRYAHAQTGQTSELSLPLRT